MQKKADHSITIIHSIIQFPPSNQEKCCMESIYILWKNWFKIEWEQKTDLKLSLKYKSLKFVELTSDDIFIKEWLGIT